MLNDFASMTNTSPAGDFVRLAQMLPTPSWNPELEAVLGGAKATDASPVDVTEQQQLQGASVTKSDGTAPSPASTRRNSKKRRNKGPDLSVDTSQATAMVAAAGANVVGKGDAKGTSPMPISPQFNMISPAGIVSPSSAGGGWLMTPGNVGFASFGLGAFPPTPGAYHAMEVQKDANGATPSDGSTQVGSSSSSSSKQEQAASQEGKSDKTSKKVTES